MGERLITLVRHGRYNRGTNLPGGGDLIADGVEQAEYLADILARQYPVSAIYTSTLRRAVHTGHIIASRIPDALFIKDKILCEAVFHVPEQNYNYFARHSDISPATIATHRVRVAHAYKKYIRPVDGPQDEHDVIVGHGNVIRYFIIRAMRAPLELWAQMEIYHGSITRLLVEADGHIRLVTHNEVAHLPRHLWTTS